MIYPFACYDGGEHQWMEQGDGYYQWTSNGTYQTRPDDAPFFSRIRCGRCGASTYVNSQYKSEPENRNG